MFDLSKVKGLLVDFGGTIDSNGMHWAEVMWMAYEEFHVPITKEVFREAYEFCERALAKNPVVKPHHTLSYMLWIKLEVQIEWMLHVKYLSKKQVLKELPFLLSDYCHVYALNTIKNTRPVLEQLAEKYPMVLVSNFYGNMESVLKKFQLDHLFKAIVESAVVGVRKPDPEIFRMGVEKLQLPAENIVVIGDSHDKDIIPAEHIGCQTIWIKNMGWNEYNGTETANAVITDFRELKSLFNL